MTTNSADAKPAEATTAQPLYGGWLQDIAKRFGKKVDDMRAEYNFDLGDEFEIAICMVLRDVLPERAAVCRGFVVERSGKKVGDDIIVYDAARFPTLRSLGRNLHLKEQVPAEAVLAYIEAKHTLYLDPLPASVDRSEKLPGQHIFKALAQVEDLKSVQRAEVPVEAIFPRVNLGKGITATRPVGFPKTRNPWYAAVLAAKVSCASAGGAVEACWTRLVEAARTGLELTRMPDVIAAGNLVVIPSFKLPGGEHEVRPFLCADTPIHLTEIDTALGLALVHLIWAIEDITLGDIPWAAMLHQELRKVNGTGALLVWPPADAAPPGEPEDAG